MFKKKLRVIIAGSRNFSDYELLKRECDKYLKVYKRVKIEIVSGCAKGADKLGERYAAERGYLVKRFPADWGAHGKAAGYWRNKQMAEYAHDLIAFWDGESRGTKSMIDLATDILVNHEVIMF